MPWLGLSPSFQRMIPGCSLRSLSLLSVRIRRVIHLALPSRRSCWCRSGLATRYGRSWPARLSRWRLPHLVRWDVSVMRCVWQFVSVMFCGFQFMYFVVAFGAGFRCLGDGVRGAASAVVCNHKLAARGVSRCGLALLALRRSFLRVWSMSWLVMIPALPGVVPGVVRRPGPWCQFAGDLRVCSCLPDDFLDGCMYPFQVSVIGDGEVFGVDEVGRVVFGA